MYMQLIAPCTINMHAGMAGGNGDHIHMDMRHARLRYAVLYLPLIKRMLEPPLLICFLSYRCACTTPSLKLYLIWIKTLMDDLRGL